MYKVLVLVSLVVVTGCVTFPNFPTFFYSQQDLRDQEREIDSSLRKEIN